MIGWYDPPVFPVFVMGCGSSVNRSTPDVAEGRYVSLPVLPVLFKVCCCVYKNLELQSYLLYITLTCFTVLKT